MQRTSLGQAKAGNDLDNENEKKTKSLSSPRRRALARRALAHRVGNRLAFVRGLRLVRLGAIGVINAFAPVFRLPATSAMMFPIADVALAVLAASAGIRRLALGIFTAALFSILPGATPAPVRLIARLRRVLRDSLRLGGHDDAIVMLGVLEIALSGHDVAGGQGVASERHILLRHVGRGPANLHLRAVRLVTP